MTVDVCVERVIDAPVDVVAPFAGDPSNAPRWYRRISVAEWRDEPDLAVGGRIDFEARFLGRVLRYTYEITELTPGEHMTMSTAAGPFPMTTTYTWTPAGQGSTRMALRNRGEPVGFARLGAPLMAVAMRRAMTQDLADLASILEDRAGIG